MSRTQFGEVAAISWMAAKRSRPAVVPSAITPEANADTASEVGRMVPTVSPSEVSWVVVRV